MQSTYILKKAHLVPLFLIIAFLFSPGNVFASGIEFENSASQYRQSLFQVDDDNQNCVNLDVIFIIDQSWSMSAPGTAEASDPLKQRKYAVDAMVDLLTNLALDQCSGTHHRLGVISFGTSPRVDLDLSFTDIAPSSQEQASILRDEFGIKQNIVAGELGQTNPLPAFDLARKMFRLAPEIGDGPRKKVVIFFTDGIPDCDNCPDNPLEGAIQISNRVSAYFPFDSVLLNRESCLSELRETYSDDEDGPPDEKVNDCLDAHRVEESVYKESVYIWTVFLKPPGYAQYDSAYRDVINYYDSMSEEHGGDAIELSATSLNDIPTEFRKIISALAGVRPVLLECGNFSVDPYLSEARLTVYKIDPEIQVTLSYFDVGGNRHEIVGGQASTPSAFIVKDYYAFGANEAYILEFPYPGIWQLTADNCNGLDTYYEKVEIDTTGYQSNIPAVIPQYDLPPYYDENAPQYLQYEMRDAQTGVVVQQADHPRFEVNVNATVLDPNGEENVYPMVWRDDEQKFISQNPLQVALSGPYEISIEGSTYVHEGNPSPVENNYEQVFALSRILFNQTDITFDVGLVAPFDFVVVEPVPGTTITNVHQTVSGGWPLKPELLPVRVKLVDRDGNVLSNPEDYLAITQSAFKASVVGNGIVSPEITLTPDPENPGFFQGEIPEFDVEGEQELTVRLVQQAVKSDARPDRSFVEASFSRKDSFFHNPTAYKIMLVALILFMIIWVIYYFATHNNKVSGNLVFKDGDTTIAEFNLNSGNNWRLIRSRELENFPQLMLKKIKVTNVGGKKRKQQEDSSDEFLQESAFGGGSQRGVRVLGTTDGGRKFSIDHLEPDLPTPYGDESFAQMIYEPLE